MVPRLRNLPVLPCHSVGLCRNKARQVALCGTVSLVSLPTPGDFSAEQNPWCVRAGPEFEQAALLCRWAASLGFALLCLSPQALVFLIEAFPRNCSLHQGANLPPGVETVGSESPQSPLVSFQQCKGSASLQGQGHCRRKRKVKTSLFSNGIITKKVLGDLQETRSTNARPRCIVNALYRPLYFYTLSIKVEQ